MISVVLRHDVHSSFFNDDVMSGQRRRRSRGGPATGFTIKVCFTPEQMAGISWGLKMIIVGYSGYMGDILEFTL